MSWGFFKSNSAYKMPEFASIRATALFLQVLLALGAIVALCAFEDCLWDAGIRLPMLHKMIFDYFDLYGPLGRGNLVSGLILCFGCSTASLFIYRFSQNLHAMGIPALQFTPWQSLAAFWIPVINFRRPLLVLQEFWKASSPDVGSSDDLSWRNIKPLSLLDGWFILWSVFLSSLWIACVCGVCQYNHWLSFVQLQYSLMLTTLSITALCVVKIPLVHLVQVNQDKKYRRFVSEKSEGSPGLAISAADKKTDWLLRFIIAAFAVLGLILVLPFSRGQWCMGAVTVTDSLFGSDSPQAEFVSKSAADAVSGPYAECEALYQKYLSILIKRQGADSLSVARPSIVLGNYKFFQQKYQEGEALYHRALSIQEKALGPDSLELAETTKQLAVWCIYYNDSEAVSLFRRALAIEEKDLGAEAPEVASTCTALADLYAYKSGNYKAAELWYKRALTIREKHCKPGDPTLMWSMNNLANTFFQEKKYSEAEDLYKHSLKISANSPNHTSFALQQITLANFYTERGQYVDAERLYKSALKTTEQSKYNWGLAFTCEALARSYQRQGKYSEAEPLYLRSISLKERDEFYLWRYLLELATLYDAQKRFVESSAVIQRAETVAHKFSKSSQPNPEKTIVPKDFPNTDRITIFRAGTIRQLLSKIPEKEALEYFPWARDFLLDQQGAKKGSAREYLILNLKPVIYDFGSQAIATSNGNSNKTASQSTADSHTQANSNDATDLAVIDRANIIINRDSACTLLAAIDRKTALANFPWCKEFLPGGKHFRTSLPATTAAGSKLSLQDLMPWEGLILPNEEVSKLETLSGRKLADLRTQQGK